MSLARATYRDGHAAGGLIDVKQAHVQLLLRARALLRPRGRCDRFNVEKLGFRFLSNRAHCDQIERTRDARHCHPPSVAQQRGDGEMLGSAAGD